MNKASIRLSEMMTPETTAAGVAEVLGVTRQTVWLWRNARGRPSYQQMLRLRDEFGIPVEDWEDTAE